MSSWALLIILLQVSISNWESCLASNQRRNIFSCRWKDNTFGQSLGLNYACFLLYYIRFYLLFFFVVITWI